jgi:hypothetical protein
MYLAFEPRGLARRPFPRSSKISEQGLGFVAGEAIAIVVYNDFGQLACKIIAYQLYVNRCGIAVEPIPNQFCERLNGSCPRNLAFDKIVLNGNWNMLFCHRIEFRELPGVTIPTSIPYNFCLKDTSDATLKRVDGHGEGFY